MALNIGTWKLNANGIVGNLTIQSADEQGNVIAHLSGMTVGGKVGGFWNESTQQLTLICRLPVGGQQAELDAIVDRVMVFNGYRFGTPLNPQPGQDITWTLAGTYQAFQVAGGTARRNVFGWYAEFSEIV